MFYNRKCHLEKNIKKYEKHENFDRIKVIELFYKIINRLLGLILKRERIFKFDLILNKVFMILDYKIKINTKEVIHLMKPLIWLFYNIINNCKSLKFF